MSWGLAIPETWGEYTALWVFATLILNLLRGRFSPVRGLATEWCWMLLPALLVLGLVPLDGLYLAGYPRGVWGDLSVTSLVLLGIGALRPPLSEGAGPQMVSRPVWLLIAVAGVLFYAGALGATEFDPYSLGYRPQALLIGVGAVAVIATWTGGLPLALILTLAVLAHALGLGESGNLWDYLVDAPLVLAAWLLWLDGRGGRAPTSPGLI